MLRVRRAESRRDRGQAARRDQGAAAAHERIEHAQRVEEDARRPAARSRDSGFRSVAEAEHERITLDLACEPQRVVVHQIEIEARVEDPAHHLGADAFLQRRADGCCVPR